MTEQGWAEPLAIIGMSCRYPGSIDSPEDLWRVLADGRDVFSDFPTDRGWNPTDGRSAVDRGGFLADAAGFDPAFFGISPREALAMDPQQRQLLEATWELFEQAGIDPAAVRGSRTGVFVGAEPRAYGPRLHQAPEGLAGHLLTGTTTSVASGRIAYAFGLNGPVLTVDTSASSSLVAVHLAAQALHTDQCTVAVAGGVSVLTGPGTFTAFSTMRGLAPDGRCKPFADTADGTAWSEGVGLVALERLSDARRNGHQVLAVLRGSAVNSDGAGDGLTVPNGDAQQAVIRAALANAGLSAGDVDAVEAHGTGTRLGDPIEAAALIATYGREHTEDHPLWLGSVKSNIGHTQAAAGVAGLIKMVLALRHAELPRTLHADVPSTRVDWSAGGVRLLARPVAWPAAADRVRRAGVSSFGLSGTNAHVLVEEPPAPEPSENPSSAGPLPAVLGGVVPWVVSGRTDAALRGQAARLRELVVARPGLGPVDVGWSLASSRSVFEHRAVVAGGGYAEGLAAVVEGQPRAGVVSGAARGGARVGFVFAGQGSQRAGMAAGLYAASSVFAVAFDRVCEVVERDLGLPVREVVLEGAEGDARADLTVFAQAGLFALQVGLVEVLKAAGVRPAVVAGHSVGEVAAAYVAGVLSLEDACALVAGRGRVMQALPEGGAMVSIAVSEAEVRAEIGERAGVGIAAVNGPAAVVVSGERDAVDAVAGVFAERGVRVRSLRVSHAFHSHRMDPALDELAEIANGLAYGSAEVPWVSTSTGAVVESCDGSYWAGQARGAVRYADAVTAMAGLDVDVFIEIGPDGTLSTLGAPNAPEAAFVSLQRPGHDAAGAFVDGLAQAWVRGVSVDWAALIGPGERVDLPTYAFQHERYWLAPDDTSVEAVWLREPEPYAGAPAVEDARPGGGLAGDPLDLVRGHAAAVLGHAGADAVDPERTFKELGFDSVTGVELRNRLAAATALPLPHTLVFDQPTPTRAAAYLRSLSAGTAGTAGQEPEHAVRAADHGEPIAIVSLSCRYPGGVDTPEEFWRLLAEGGDAVGAFPGDRGWELPETPHAHAGGFLRNVDEFDPAFFDISPREALAMDPQQRLLLETSWEALERAVGDPTSLRGSATGVFVGATVSGYGTDAEPGAHDGHLITGTAASVMSGRVAYAFGLEGPAVTVDTACSSSLVALHLACQALRSDECTLALVGGVSVMTTPEWFVWFSRQDGLAADGRSKAFSASADGMGMAEGAGMIVAERLSDARRHGHRVLAVVRGSAVNQDGASNGLTAPNGPSQQRVIRAALAAARLTAPDVDAVEAHGTGTELGDPIEAQALLATYGQGRPEDRPLLLGSVKSNIGHTQWAAGIAGVMKMVLAMQHQELPSTLHADQPTDRVDWSTGSVRLLHRPAPWPAGGRRRRAGVSSFGISGTNAHVILEEAPDPATASAPAPLPSPVLVPVPAPPPSGEPHPGAADPGPDPDASAGRPAAPLPWTVSARTPEALAAQAAKLGAHLAADRAEPPAAADVAWSLAATRTAFAHRAVVLGIGRGELLDALGALAAGAQHPDLVTGVTGTAGLLAFVFTGQGAQRTAMGRGLYAEHPVFAAAFDEVCAVLDPLLGGSVAAVVDDGPIHDTMWTQAGLFALEVALHRLLASWGLRPDLVAGHSIGEIAAAHVAGLWSLPDACAVVAARGRLMQELPPGGAMVAVAAAETRVREVLERHPGAAVAAVNGPRAVVVSGTEDAVLAAAGELAEDGARTRRLTVSHAFHSPLMEPMLDAFAEVLGAVTYRRPRLRLVSALTGAEVTDEVTDPAYWVRHVRDTVRFGDAVATLRAAGARTFVEIGPDGALTAMGAQSGAEGSGEAWLAALRRDRDEARTLLGTVAAAYTRGAAVDWTAVLARTGGTPVELPTYAFQRQKYWLTLRTAATDAAGLGQTTSGHPLVGAAIDLPATGGLVLTGRLSTRTQPWLADHTVAGRVVVPGTAFVDMAVRAGDEAGCGLVEELLVEAPLALPARGGVQVRVTVAEPDATGRRDLAVHARAEDTGPDGAWTRHATGVLAADPTDTGTEPPAPAPWPPAGAEPAGLDDLYPALARGGLGYGPAFRGVSAMWRKGVETFAEVELPEGLATTGFGVHPALLDAALHAIDLDGGLTGGPTGGLTGGGQGTDGPRLPFAWTGVRLRATDATALRVTITPARETGTYALALADRTGAPVADIDALTLRALPAEGTRADGLFRTDWVPADTSSAEERPPRVALLAPDAVGPDGSDCSDGRRPDGPDPLSGPSGPPALSGAVRHAALTDLTAAAAAGDLPDAVIARCASPEPDPVRAAHDVAHRALDLVRRWLDTDLPQSTRLVLVTRGAVAPGTAGPDPAAAAAWGLVRVAQTENPGRLVLADLDGEPAPADDAEGRALLAGIALGAPEFAVRAGHVLLPRLVRATDALAAPAGANWRLAVQERGTLDQLRLVPDPDLVRPLAPGEVRVGLRASGVNFRDVLNTLGMYPGEAGPLGIEGAGVVLDTGPDTAGGLAVGDRVMGLFPGSFAPTSVTDARLLAPIPVGWSFAEAAGAPVVYLTAYHALVELAGLHAGESVLVHAAAGGVGMAAVQLARHLGAEVYGTAGPGKWPALRPLGLDDAHLASSRTLAFEDAFRAATGGRGVDVVLDSLAGEFVDASLRLTAPGGRFVEMGKTDVRDADEVRDTHGVAYQAFDLLQLPPDHVAAMLGALAGLFADGTLAPLPLTCWDIRRAPDAFRHLSQARHTGKVVLTTGASTLPAPRGAGDGTAAPGEPAPPSDPWTSGSHPARTDTSATAARTAYAPPYTPTPNIPPAAALAGTTLVTGASGGLGALVARHLADQGRAARLLLTSRRGPGAPGAAALAADIAGAGVDASLAACDAADRDALAALLDRVPADFPLRDVVHAAGVLDDGVIGALTPERLDRAMRPKADAAWHLHELTAGLDLRSFVLFSSVAGTWGFAGQGNYAAANAFLDALAAHRRTALGLPATALAWGPWAQAGGMAGRLAEADLKRMARDGFRPLTDADGLALLDAAPGTGQAAVIAADLDTAALRARDEEELRPFVRGLVHGTGREGAPHGRAARIRRASASGPGAAASGALAARIAALPPAERAPELLRTVLAQAAFVLGMPGLEPAAAARSFRELGLDSLTSVELRNRLTAATDTRLNATVVFDYPTPNALTDHLLGRLLGDAAGADTAGSPAPAAPAPAHGDDPLVIVGLGCRFPGGADSPEKLWDLVARGADAIGPFPDDRSWDPDVYDPDPAAVGKSYSRTGGFLYDAGGFDAEFFGIHAREALAMDPQQRLLLEVSWEALERAGIDPAALHGTATGVFTGLIYHDYGQGTMIVQDADGYLATGGSGGVASGRLSYVLGLEGPAVTIDTACSSSLVALHLAAQALRSGECDLALVGGVTVMATPGTFVDFSRQQGLAADGRCKAYAGGADGTSWGEGVGVAVVERLSDARRNGHQVLAVVRGSAINQDGASNGLTAPNGPSQQRVIRAALANAGLTTADVDAVEGHGTGTTLGDPIEAQALLATYGQDRPEDRPLWLGSVKSNIGHSQAAAGMAGIIKMVAAMHHGTLPRTLHVDAPSHHIDWTAGNVRLLTEPVPWPARDERARRAGVSSFGFSGTNAHVILEEPPAQDGPAAPAPTPGVLTGATPWALSGRTDAALRGQAERLRAFASARPDLPAADVAWSLATSRTAFEHRAVAIDGAPAALGALAAGRPEAGVATGTASASGTGRTVFVFPGQGAQWVGMGRELLACSPVFAERMAQCAAALEPFVDWSLHEVLDDAGALESVDVVQPVLWAVMVSLAAVWQAAGVAPDTVLGHSQGEIAAATVAGLLPLADGARVVALRSRVLRALSGAGGMVSVAQSADAVRERIAGFGERLSVAVVNSAEATVVSGTPDALDELVAGCEADGVRVRRLPMDYASHSAQMEQLRDELLDLLPATHSMDDGVTAVPMMSAMSVAFLDSSDLGARHWYESLRAPVEFERSVRSLAGSGHGVFVEMSPHPVLTAHAAATLEDAGVAAPVVVGSLRRDEGGPERLLTSMAEAWVRGVAVDWAAVVGSGERVELPTYAFQHERYWPRPLTARPDGGLGHPLLSASVELASGAGLVVAGAVSLRAQPWLGDHAVGGAVLLPGTAFVEMAVRAGDVVGCGRLEELMLEAPLLLGDAAVEVQVVVGAEEAGVRGVEVHSRPSGEQGDAPWTRHAGGSLSATASAPASGDLVVWPPRDATPLAVDDWYAHMATQGYAYGPVFQGLRAAWRRGDEVFAEVALPEAAAADAGGFGVHPALLDAALHLSELVLPEGRAGEVRLPFAWTGVDLHASGASVLRVKLSSDGAGGLALVAVDGAGSPVVSVDSLVLRPVAAGALGGAAPVVRDGLYGVEWVRTSAATEPVPSSVAVVGTGLDEVDGAAWYADLGALVAAVGSGAGVPDVVVVAAGVGSARGVTAGVLGVVQGWLGAVGLSSSRLVVVTRGAVSTGPGEGVVDLAGAAVWGLVRSAQSEEPGRFVLVDAPGLGAGALGVLVDAVASGEPEVAVRGDAVLARRLVRPAGGLVLPARDGATGWRLDAERPGTLEGLAIVERPDGGHTVEPGEVRIAVRAAGVNFRDVAVALDLARVPGAGIGSEVAGVVAEVGADVTGWAVGDRVMGIVEGGFADHVAVDARALAVVPAGWSFARAAGVPVGFSTAWYGLVDLAGARSGQRVLIHAATGGVGMAAVQIARHLGLEVFATASPGKWGVLASMGIDEAHIASSRDAGFEEKFSGGVDIVLNALAGELTDASLRLLRGGGVFLEMGKTDLRDAEDIATRYEGVRYRAFSTGEAGAERLGEILAEVNGLLVDGVLAGVPVRCWDVRRAVDALRFMSQARHVGKIVLTVPAPVRASGTVLVTGGTGMIGGRVARHLVETGRAGQAVLVSRSGPSASGVAELVAGLASAGADSRVVACDAADRTALAGLLGGLSGDRPVTSVFHSVGVLDDGVITSLDAGRVDAVMRPKTDAAWNLHELTAELDLDLDAFVLFSSAAATFGTGGQANYAAANAYLDGLAARRRADGLPAVSLAWGFWAEASGMTGHLDTGDKDRLGRDGIGAMSNGDGLALLDAALERDEALFVPAVLDLAGVRAAAARGEQVPALWRALTGATGPARPTAGGAGGGTAAAAGGTLADQLARLTVAEQERALLDLVMAHAAAVLNLGTASTALGPDRAFRDVGFDSLTAVELRNRLNAAAGLRLPSTLVFDYPTPVLLAGFLRVSLVGDTVDTATAAAEPAVPGGAPAAGADGTPEPVAIVGLGCRLPGGVDSPEDFWAVLSEGRDVIGAFPDDRGWDLEALYDEDPDRVGRSYVREGGFVEDAGGFDAGFFGIAPREALAMDPQQRVLLEVAWEALERSGIDPGGLRGSQTGVFVGGAASGYGADLPEDAAAEGYLMTGTAASVLSGRLSYTLGLEGPASTVDTACSSSLVALHMATQALRNGECSLALAGGVTVLAVPDTVVDFSRQRGLAPDGRSKAFAEAADGMGIAEGAGMLVVERLSDARRNGHPVLAVVRGSAVNQDGASNGLTAPNGPSQQRVIRSALANARLTADQVDVVEAHGTGTKLGDPIEAQALMAAYGQGRPEDRPLLLGSVKSNIGHTQWAAGVAGVMKMVLALRHGELPRSLYAEEPSSRIDWSAGDVRLLDEAVEWPANGERVRRAGVSSFGISGTNAHVIIEEAPSEAGAEVAETAPGVVSGVVPWVVSGRSEGALRAQAGRLRELMVAKAELAARDVAWSLAVSRSVFAHRAVVVGDGGLAGLGAVVAGQPAAGTAVGVVPAVGVGRSVFVFPGQGAQWVGMGRELLMSSAVFAARFAECGGALAPYVEWSLEEVLGDAVALERVDVVQPVLWAVMVSLAAVWEAAGVRPDAVVGHSQGEIAAAVVAGLLSVEDGARVVALRSLALRALAGKGGMVSVARSAGEVKERIAEFGDRLSVAVVNSAEATVVSGDPEALGELVAGCEGEGVRVRRLPVDYASHSAQVDGLREEIVRALDEVAPLVDGSGVPMLSAMSGEWLGAADLGAGYWFDSLRAPVEFDRAVRTLAEAGHGVFVEMSAHPVLTGAVTATLEDAGVAAPVVVGSLRRDEGGPERLLTSMAEAWVQGVEVDWAAVIGSGERVDLPTYAFQHQRYWPKAGVGAGDMASAGLSSLGHPFLLASVELVGDGGLVTTGRLSLRGQSWLADHAVGDTALLPGTAFVEMAVSAGEAVGCGRLDELTLEAPLVLPDGPVQVQVVVGADEGGVRSVEVHSRPSGADTGAPWTRHASGILSAAAATAPGFGDLVVWPPRDATPLAVDGWYARLAAEGYVYGPVFQGMRAAWRRGDEVFAEVALPEAAVSDAGGFGVHPALLDAALHLSGLVLPEGRAGEVRLPFAWTGVDLHASGASVLRVRLSPDGAGGLALLGADPTGAPVVSVESLVLRPVAAGALGAAAPVVRDGLFGVEWTPVTPPAAAEEHAATVAVIGPDVLRIADAEVAADVAVYEDLGGLVAAVGSGAGVPDVVVVAAGPGSARGVTAGVLGLMQGWLGAVGLSSSRLVVVTRGAVSTGPGEGVVDLAGAAVWGLVRSAQSEEPDRFVLVDLPDGDALGVGPLVAAVASGEPEVAVRGDAVLARRLVRPDAGLRLPEGGGAWRVEVERPGTLEGLGVAGYPEAGAALAPGEVRVAVRAAGVNFRDVLITLGMYPGAALLGSEVAGVVTEAAPDVDGLAVGDRVMGIAAGGFADRVVVDARTLVAMPDGWSYARAAAVPVGFSTAWYGLVDLAGARSGQRVLIHAATGGVGMAAVQIARHLGLEVFATASPGKWGVLASMGIGDDHIASSRDAGFEEKFCGGVDIVLNALAGELTDASLRLLRGGGVFLEMGKTDRREPEQVAAAHPGVTYVPFETGEAGPDRIGDILGEVGALLAEGAMSPAPVRCWDVRRAVDALRFMSQARHVGKIVLTVPVAPRASGTVLVTGGTGMIGGRVARHLVESGRAGRAVLVSRSGPSASGVAELVAGLASAGADSRVVACDAADRNALAGLLEATRVTSVFHSVGVLDDGVITSLDAGRVDAVMRPKADAAWNLHELTAELDLDLDAFVLFSSAAATFGGPGQGNYAAANAYLDGLAARRRADGLPGASLAWGFWAEASGMTGHLDAGDKGRIGRDGIKAMSTDDGLALLDAALGRDEPLLVPAVLDVAGVRAAAARGEQVPAVWRGLAGGAVRPSAGGAHRAGAAAGTGGGPGGEDGAALTLAQRIAPLSPAEQDKLLLDLVLAHAAPVLGHGSPDAVRPDLTFREAGFDSLAAVELRNRLNAAAGLRLPSTLVFDFPTPVALAAHLRGKLVRQETAAGYTSALRELDRLEAVLAATGGADGLGGLDADGDDGEGRSALVTRLEAIVQSLRGGSAEAGGGPANGSAAADAARARKLAEATDEEIFDLIDNELEF
ncbi:putative polyketide synthase [Actinacidiphila reveromycinica]|uniref:Putative polyketide synthase n=1 Tax=Actinacidiphila reveromycinica TaxID=659352 RepID=A0A7U3VSV5_9ACTN|nr:type I polyketide synthase [Streptomyces sp. SN-593]BBB02235.1 putative polyketide synthase [Streptomyces sp. SN-593]